MADFTINGKPVQNEETLAALEEVSSQKYFNGFHNNDTDFTEEELGRILDIFSPADIPGKGEVDSGDKFEHVIKKTGLTPTQFVALAKEYHKRFPQGKKHVNTGLWKRRKSNWISQPRRLISQPRHLRTSRDSQCSEISQPPSIKQRPTSGPAKHIHVFGPGGTAFDSEHANKMSMNISKHMSKKDFTAIGDGEHAIDISKIREVVRKAKNDQKPITLFIEAHGKIGGARHLIEIDDGKYIPTRKVFQILNEESVDGSSLSIFMTSCHGGAAASEAVYHLPRGARLIALAPSSESVAGSDVENLADILGDRSADLDGNKWAEGIDILYLYLTQALENRIAPEIALAGEGKLNLRQEMICRIGKSFSPDEKSHVHSRLDPLLGKGAVADIIAKLEGASDEYQIYAKDFGKALAVILALHDEREQRPSA